MKEQKVEQGSRHRRGISRKGWLCGFNRYSAVDGR